MYTKSLLAALIAAPAAVAAAGNAIVESRCSYPAYMWSVSSDGVGTMKTINYGETISEPYYAPTKGGGVSIKITKVAQGPYDSGNMAQFEYTLDNMIWYDISLINGNPFMDAGMTLTPTDKSCPTKVCPAKQQICKDAYNNPDENLATGACAADADTKFVLCAGNPPLGSAHAPKQELAPVVKEEAVPTAKKAIFSAAAPAATEAPVVAAPAADAGVFTTFVTKVVTIAAREAAPEPTALPLKRDDSHVNMHKRAAHRHHFHRHGADVN